MSGLGHNNPPKDRSFKRRWALAVLAHPNKPAGAVALAFKLYMEMDASGHGAIISDREFMDCCGVSKRACQNFKGWLIDEGFVHIHVRGYRGSASEFVAHIPETEIDAQGAPIQKGTEARDASIPNGIQASDAPKQSGIGAPCASSTDEIGAQNAPDAPIPEISPAPTRAEVYNNIYNNINNLNTPSHTEQVAVRAREGEEDFGHGVFVNCETIRHHEFSISLKAIELQLCGTVPLPEIKQIALGHALQWALDLEGGKRNVVPSNTANFIRASIQGRRNNDAVTEVRKEKARSSSRHVPREAGESFDDINRRILAELNQEGRR